jgi:uncharacterized metal-binding protein YceD (DUF177 family)
MFIHLHEIPKEGKNWIYDESHREAKAALQDLLFENKFKVEVAIEPLGSTGTYNIRGEIKAQWPEDCSRCGDGFEYSASERFAHLLMPSMPSGRVDKTAKPNHVSDSLTLAEGDALTEVFEYEGNSFDVGSFLHELVALAKPLIPAPELDSSGNCVACKICVKNKEFSYDESVEVKKSPFAGLGALKLNS